MKLSPRVLAIAVAVGAMAAGCSSGETELPQECVEMLDLYAEQVRYDGELLVRYQDAYQAALAAWPIPANMTPQALMDDFNASNDRLGRLLELQAQCGP